ncbi:unnamed protein product [Oikopleura dioica]|uniref:Nuclear condensin complex subunit 3 C-terminal domain-containing protein n=1 Tax=Oikopleura dioica TaxID=34765 RepID=E4XTC1_OIKDI|nr:unnamed protein product [Oikopleura dioica]
MYAINDEDQENDPVIHGNPYAIEFVLEALANMMTTRSAVIRSYSCDLIGKLLVDIPQEYELSLPVISNMTESLVTRANDQSSSVRLLALDALNRLQDPRNRDCPVTAQYLPLTRRTLSCTIDRCLDEDLRVRKEAVKKIADKVKYHVLTDVQVRSLLKHGLDDEPQVRDVVINNLIPGWLTHIRKHGRKNEKGNLIDLVMSLDPSSTDGTSFETSRATIEVVFDQWESLEGLVKNYCQASERLVTFNMLPNINEENVGPAVAFTWFHFVQRAVKLGDAEAYMPQFTDFCVLIEERARMIVHIRTELEESDAYFENRQEFAGDTVRLEDHLFEIKWLIKALTFFDISLDPMNREKLKSLLQYIVVKMFPKDLQEISECIDILVSEVARAEKQRKNDIVKQLVEVLREEGSTKIDCRLADDESQINTQIADEQLEELRNEIGEVQMRIHLLENQQRDAIEEKNFSEASRLEEAIKPHKAQLQKLQIRKNQTKRLPATINSQDDDSTKHRFTYCSAQKALILLNGHMSRLKTLELGLDQFVKILVVPVLMKISIGEITGDKKQPALLEEQAIKCLGLICSLNLSTAKEYFATLVVIAQNEANNVGAMARQAAIQSVIDLALIYDNELTKDLDTTQLESILQSTANESTWGDTAINATTVLEEGPQTICAKLLVAVLREGETDENKYAREISIDGLVSIQLAHRAPSAALQLQVLLHICSKEYHGHDMADYHKAMTRIVLNEEAFKMLVNTLRLALNHIISKQDNLVDLDGASAERILPLIFKLANPEAYHKASEECSSNHIIDIIKVPLRLVMVILEVARDHFIPGVTSGILKLCTDIDITHLILPLKQICDDSKFEETLPLREEIYRIYDKANEINPLIKERHAKDAIRSLISSFHKKVRVCAAVEEHQKNKIEATKKIEEEKENNKQELEKGKKYKRRKSEGAKKSSDKTMEEELQECAEQMTLPEEDEKDDAEASSSDAVQEVPKKKAKTSTPSAPLSQMALYKELCSLNHDWN